MITVEEIQRELPRYTQYQASFGNHRYAGGDALLRDLEVDPALPDFIDMDAPDLESAAGWVFGFTFALWLMREKRGR